MPDAQAAKWKMVVVRSALLAAVICARGASAAAGLVGYWPLDGGHKTAVGGPKAATAMGRLCDRRRLGRLRGLAEHYGEVAAREKTLDPLAEPG